MTVHTKTPWFSKLRESQIAIYGPGEIQVVATSWHGSIRASYPLKQESIANAAFIVKAVNSHDALVKALEDVVREFDKAECWDSVTRAKAALASIKVQP